MIIMIRAYQENKYFLRAFQANKQKGQKLNINIGVTDKKRCD